VARAATAVAPRAMARFETERTYIMIKPDGVQRGVVGDIISRFERKGFVLKGLKLFQCPKSLAEEHYKARARGRAAEGGARAGAA
jgi:nucleoside-diphosphate kinase